MNIFLTGGTGYIGSAVLEALVRAGHQVTALVRNPERASRVAARGARPVIADLGQPTSYRQAAIGHDAYIHTAKDHSSRAETVDRATIDTLLPIATAGPGAVVIYTSGVWVLGNTHGPVAEDAPLDPAAISAWRPSHEKIVLGASSNGVRVAVVRPGIVYGSAQGIVGDMFRDAANGLMRVVGSGENHWPLIYDRDLADLYVRILSRRDAAGVFHATDDGDERVNDLVEAIGTHTSFRPEVRHMPIAEARGKLGPYADALALDQIVRSPRARALGWAPTLHSVGRNVARLFEEWRTGREAA
jgi:nucleoside-diphosphate-sugar epimerase